MNQTEETKLLEQNEKWNDADEFSRCIEAVSYTHLDVYKRQVSHSGGGMLRQGTRKGIRRTPANRGMRAHWVVKGLEISEDVCQGMCP